MWIEARRSFVVCSCYETLNKMLIVVVNHDLLSRFLASHSSLDSSHSSLMALWWIFNLVVCGVINVLTRLEDLVGLECGNS